MAEEERPRSRAQLLNEIEREWSKLLVTIEKIPSDRMNEPDEGGWSPKDNIAHLTEWMKLQLGYHMDGRPAHEVAHLSPEDLQGWDFEHINQIFFERNRNRSVDDVVDELKLVYSEIVGRLESMPFEDLLKPRWPDQPERGPLLNWVLGNTSEHFAEHRQNMEKAAAHAPRHEDPIDTENL
jgi:hypothetical protein